MKKILVFISSAILLCSLAYSQIDDTTLVVAENQEAELAYNEGIKNFSKKKFRQALANFEQAIKFKPNFDKAYYNRGCVKSELKDFKGAISDFDFALGINSEMASAYFSRARAKLATGDNQGALEDFTTAIQKGYDEAKVYYYRGVAKFQLENYKASIEDFTQAIYKNGELDKSRAQGSLAASANGLSLGERLGGGFNLEGYIGEMAVYSRALTPSEILRNYLATKWRYQ